MTTTEMIAKKDSPTLAADSREAVYVLFGLLAGLTALVTWSYWNSLELAAGEWMGAQYSHGWLVPVFALVLLWLRGEPYGISVEAIQDNTWGNGLLPAGGVPMRDRLLGLALLLAGLGGRLYCANMGYEAPDLFTIIPTLAGVFLLVGGLRVLQWAGPAIAFLFFMCPLPWTIADPLFKTLQSIATAGSTFVLQTLGFAAFRSGNIITLGPDIQPLNVIDQCSGLRMLTIFVALSFAVAIVIQRPLWERIFIILSSVPIAIAVNVARISITGMLHVAFHGTAHADIADKFFHDFAGWVMMPMAMVLLFLEFMLLQHLTIPEEAAPLPSKRQRPISERKRRSRRSSGRSSRSNPATASPATTIKSQPHLN